MKERSPLDSALRMLTLRDHSEAELSRKLREKGFEEQMVVDTVARLKELRYLDDARFAHQFAAAAVRNGRGYGVRLKMELARRGVSPAIVSEVMDEIEAEHGEQELIAEMMERRFASFDPESATEKERRRIIGYLQRKGFSLSAIFRQLKSTAWNAGDAD
ncbi:recombination regulator RecX [Geomonas sp. Red32]|nr:recombination regulator RecX [Geomonas sp. Red32]